MSIPSMVKLEEANKFKKGTWEIGMERNLTLRYVESDCLIFTL